jgi:hypothetical protein
MEVPILQIAAVEVFPLIPEVRYCLPLAFVFPKVKVQSEFVTFPGKRFEGGIFQFLYPISEVSTNNFRVVPDMSERLPREWSQLSIRFWPRARRCEGRPFRACQ